MARSDGNLEQNLFVAADQPKATTVEPLSAHCFGELLRAVFDIDRFEDDASTLSAFGDGAANRGMVVFSDTQVELS